MGTAGLLGVLSFHEGWDIGDVIRYGLSALRHRGEVYLVSVLSNEGLLTKRLDDVKDIDVNGWAGIACSATDDSVFGVIKCGNVDVAYCYEGQEINEGEICDIVLNGKAPGKSLVLLALTSNGHLVGYRSVDGRRALSLGAYGFDLAYMSNETAAISAAGGAVRTPVRPGSIIDISRYVVRELRAVNSDEDPKLCSLEFIYMSRADSEIDGHSVYAFRKALAQRLAARLRGRIADSTDLVVGVPDTGTLYALKVGEALGKPVELALMNVERRRSAIMDEITTRRSIIHLKVNPIIKELRGRRVLLIDDSLLSGLTIKEVSQILRHRAGVREVHVGIASPRIARACPYGVTMPPTRTLLARVFREDKELIKVLEVDSITWASIDDLTNTARDVGITGKLCMECFRGGD
jgi:amidophosphoribosyltransferase